MGAIAGIASTASKVMDVVGKGISIGQQAKAAGGGEEGPKDSVSQSPESKEKDNKLPDNTDELLKKIEQWSVM